MCYANLDDWTRIMAVDIPRTAGKFAGLVRFPKMREIPAFLAG